MYKQDMALKNSCGLICHKSQPTNQNHLCYVKCKQSRLRFKLKSPFMLSGLPSIRILISNDLVCKNLGNKIYS